MRRILGLVWFACIAAAAAASDTESTGGAALKIYADQLDPAVFTRVMYGYDRDEVCGNGLCDNGTTACATNAACAGIGDGLCNYTACTGDFDACDDGKPCQNNGNCAGIGSGVCHNNPCAPPNNICGVLVEHLTPGAPAGQTIGQLVLAGSWDFSQNNPTNLPALVQTASTTTPINSSETPNWNQCGFSEPGSILDRQDKDWPGPYVIKTLNSIERENGIKVCMNGTAGANHGAICTTNANCTNGGTCVTTSTIWLRAAARYEGIASADLGAGESRICHVGGTRTPVPLWRFPNADAGGQFMQLGDVRWEHTAFNCQPTILFPVAVSSYACSGFEGKQTGQVVAEGVVKLPSGHQFKSLVVRSVAEYCAGLVSCLVNVDSVRTVLYLWEVPHLGTVVRLQSDKIAVNRTDFTHLSEVDIKYGLFPPLTLAVGTVTDTSVALSWDPGAVTSEIDGYRIYWDTESGGRCNVGGQDCNADTPSAGQNCPAGKTCCVTAGDTCDGYDFDSDTNAGQVTFPTATSATISGLERNTTYHFTVTAKSTFTDPSSGAPTDYESALYPTRIPAVPVDLPIEVEATTTCTPALEVSGVTLGRAGGQCQVCWNPVADLCDGYRILGAASPEEAVNFSTEADTGPVTCKTFSPSNGYFIVVGRGSGGTGPWGHYGQ